MAKEDDGDSSNAERILQNLAQRPNVQSTLILSRKDGSIIKATGLIVDEGNSDSHRHPSYSTIEASEQNEKASQTVRDENAEIAIVESVGPTSVQMMAESIYSFVASASALAESLGNISALGDMTRRSNGSGDTKSQEKDRDTTTSVNQVDNEIQLLRLRLKKQEIIIFPDPRYLCCVVQDLEKSSR